MKLHIQNNFTSELPADPNEVNIPRQVERACFSYVMPKQPSNPSLVHTSSEVANYLGLSQEDILSEDFLKYNILKKLFIKFEWTIIYYY